MVMTETFANNDYMQYVRVFVGDNFLFILWIEKEDRYAKFSSSSINLGDSNARNASTF